MFRLLRPRADVRLWSSVTPAPAFHSFPIRVIDSSRQEYPVGGTLVLVGVEEHVHPWIQHTAPERTVVIYNSSDPRYLHYVLSKIQSHGMRRPEIVFASESLMRSIGVAGTVQWGPLDLDRFAPSAPWSGRGKFVVGRMSRDHLLKHNVHDPSLYRNLGARGFDVRIMGGTMLAARMGQADGVRLLRTGAIRAAQFLGELHAFIYRVNGSWFEPFGRVVAEAMAAGLPVVCHPNGGYRDLIRHGETGFFFTSNNEAVDRIEQLRAEPALAARVGAAARADIERRFGRASQDRLIDFYCNEARPGSASADQLGPASVA